MYYRKGLINEFEKILNEALKDVDARAYMYMYNPMKDRIRALNALASYYIQISQLSSKDEDANRNVDQARQLIANADYMNLNEPISFITKSFFYLTTGQLTQAS
jgi:hypothetical protein